jgi:hypothetical protein
VPQHFTAHFLGLTDGRQVDDWTMDDELADKRCCEPSFAPFAPAHICDCHEVFGSYRRGSQDCCQRIAIVYFTWSAPKSVFWLW